MSEGACGNCRFWRDDGSGQFGVCRRDPPQIVDRLVRETLKENPDQSFSDATYQATWFPGTFVGDWCGQHEEQR